jgi:universal stress protein E
MKRFQNILVGVDLADADPASSNVLSRPSRQALARAIWLARHTGGKLTIFSALSVSPFLENYVHRELTEDPYDPAREATALLKRLVDRAESDGVRAQSGLAVGIAWEEICRQVVNHDHDLVIVGTRDLGHVGRVFFGSTGLHLLRYCPCPVWVARPDEYWEHQEILVPSDFSDVSLEALRIAIEGHSLVDTRIHVLHVLEGRVGPPSWYGQIPPQIVADYIAEQHQRARHRLHELLAKVGDRSLQHGVMVHVVEGSPDVAILKAIDDLKIDLVVMGTAARTGLGRMVLGNTTERLISHVRCSLIAVKPSEFECPIVRVTQDSIHYPSDAKQVESVH